MVNGRTQQGQENVCNILAELERREGEDINLLDRAIAGMPSQHRSHIKVLKELRDDESREIGTFRSIERDMGCFGGALLPSSTRPGTQLISRKTRRTY